MDKDAKIAQLEALQKKAEDILRLFDLKWEALGLAANLGEPPEEVVRRADIYFQFLIRPEELATAAETS